MKPFSYHPSSPHRAGRPAAGHNKCSGHDLNPLSLSKKTAMHAIILMSPAPIMRNRWRGNRHKRIIIPLAAAGPACAPLPAARKYPNPARTAVFTSMFGIFPVFQSETAAAVRHACRIHFKPIVPFYPSFVISVFIFLFFNHLKPGDAAPDIAGSF